MKTVKRTFGSKLLSTKFLLTFFIVIACLILLIIHKLSEAGTLQLIEIIIPLYFASNVAANHKSLQ